MAPVKRLLPRSKLTRDDEDSIKFDGMAAIRLLGAPSVVRLLHSRRNSSDVMRLFSQFRLRKAGGVVVFDPDLAVGYSPRGSWRTLGRQYFEYGVWKSVVLRMHPGSLRLRQLVAPVGVLSVGAALLAAVRWPRALAAPVGYLGAIVATGGGRPQHRALTMAVTVVIHTSWVSGLIVGSLTRRDHTVR